LEKAILPALQAARMKGGRMQNHTLQMATASTIDMHFHCCAKLKQSHCAHLQDYELALAFVAYLQEGLASHVLHARVRLVHKLKQLVHDRLEELPVIAQEARILPHNIPAIDTPKVLGQAMPQMLRNRHNQPRWAHRGRILVCGD
jgi:hypothetical protein